MPLDNAKLARAVSTTEKLVQRMDALEARRGDAKSENTRQAGAYAGHTEYHIKMLEENLAKAKSSGDKEKVEKFGRMLKKARGDSSRKDDYGHPVKSNNRVQQMDYGREDAEDALKTKLNNGITVLANSEGSAKTFSNRSQAQQAAEKYGGKVREPVSPSRAFYVKFD